MKKGDSYVIRFSPLPRRRSRHVTKTRGPIFVFALARPLRTRANVLVAARCFSSPCGGTSEKFHRSVRGSGVTQDPRDAAKAHWPSQNRKPPKSPDAEPTVERKNAHRQCRTSAAIALARTS